jgi:uridine kinase
LQFPRRHAPKELLPMPDYPKLLASFRQYSKWLERLGVENVGALNDVIQSGNIREIILVAEAFHEQQVAEIARKIVERSATTRIVLIAGPSSSENDDIETAGSAALPKAFSFPIELDNYFVSASVPRDENGQFDFERLEALDLALIADFSA